MLHPRFDGEDIEKEKGVILEEIKMEADSPDYLVHEIFSSNFWKDHPLGKPILGTPQSVKRFDQEMVREFFSEVYRPYNLIVTAAGNLTHDRLVDLAREHIEPLPPAPPPAPDHAPSTHARISLRNKKELEQAHLCLGVPSYPLPHEGRFACYVLNTLLGGGMSSRLFQNIRERQGLAYAVFSELNPYRDTGCLSIYAGTSLNSARKVVESILAEFRELKDLAGAGRRTAASQGPPQGVPDAQPGVDFQPDVEPGAAGDVFREVLLAGRAGGEYRVG